MQLQDHFGSFCNAHELKTQIEKAYRRDGMPFVFIGELYIKCNTWTRNLIARICYNELSAF